MALTSSLDIVFASSPGSHEKCLQHRPQPWNIPVDRILLHSRRCPKEDSIHCNIGHAGTCTSGCVAFAFVVIFLTNILPCLLFLGPSIGYQSCIPSCHPLALFPRSFHDPLHHLPITSCPQKGTCSTNQMLSRHHNLSIGSVH